MPSATGVSPTSCRRASGAGNALGQRPRAGPRRSPPSRRAATWRHHLRCCPRPSMPAVLLLSTARETVARAALVCQSYLAKGFWTRSTDEGARTRSTEQNRPILTGRGSLTRDCAAKHDAAPGTIRRTDAYVAARALAQIVARGAARRRHQHDDTPYDPVFCHRAPCSVLRAPRDFRVHRGRLNYPRCRPRSLARFAAIPPGEQVYEACRRRAAAVALEAHARGPSPGTAP